LMSAQMGAPVCSDTRHGSRDGKGTERIWSKWRKAKDRKGIAGLTLARFRTWDNVTATGAWEKVKKGKMVAGIGVTEIKNMRPDIAK